MICKIEGCGTKSYCHGMCVMHYFRWKKHGDPGGAAPMNERHGMRNTRVYRTWQGAIQRCCNPKDQHYPLYGGRGITICAEWRSSFTAFYRDMGEPPSQRHQIDRIDGNQGYRKGNCRWVLPVENTRNRPGAVKLDMGKAREIRRLKGMGIATRELMAMFGVCRATINYVASGYLWPERRSVS